MNKLKPVLFCIAFSAILFSCKKNEGNEPLPVITTGAYVLNEGSLSSGTSITFYDFSKSSAITDIYKNVNGNSLGTWGNDMIIYGSKMYVVVNYNGYLEVADANTVKSIKKIDLKSGGSSLYPRFAAPYKNKVYVSCWDGTVAVVDTASLVIDKFIKVGKNPEQMIIIGSNMYVANSGGISPGFDSTVSVIDLNTQTEVKKFTVGVNPTSLTSDPEGNIYVGCIGNYDDIPAKLVKLNSSTGQILKSADTTVERIQYYRGAIYASGGYGGAPNVRKLSPVDFSAQSDNFVTDGTKVETPYAINIDESNGDVYIGDAKNYTSPGEVFCFDASGKKKFSFSVSPGLMPNKVVFIRK